MPFEIVRNDIARMRVDAIVNAAHHLPKVGAGVDSALHQKAGPALLAARQEIGVIPYGSAAVTPAFSSEYCFRPFRKPYVTLAAQQEALHRLRYADSAGHAVWFSCPVVTQKAPSNIRSPLPPFAHREQSGGMRC